LATELQRLLWPGLLELDRRFVNKINDTDHLLGHFKNKRDVFVTDDRDITQKQAQLKDAFGIVVMRPDDALKFIIDSEERRRKIDLFADPISDLFTSRAFRGRVKFDYSSNNGRFVIGEGQHLFETRWSKASDTSIHAYTDSKSIKNLAIAKESISLEDALSNVDRFDFTSRVRTPRLEQIVIWRNTNALLAATKVIGIKDDTRGSAADELVFDYLIQAG
jgi:hypothetical protein